MQLKKAVEVFLIVRELSYKNSGMFLWKMWFEAAKAVMNPSEYQTTAGFKCTVGNMLRAQVKHGTIVRTSRGVYRMRSLQPEHPLYLAAERFNMTPGERRRKRALE